MEVFANWTLPFIFVGIVAGIGWIAGRRSAQHFIWEPEARRRRPERPVITVDGMGNALMSRQAASLLGLEASGRLTVQQVRALLETKGAELRACVDDLLSGGRSFETTIETRKGVFVQAVGAAHGTQAIIELKDQTELISRAVSAERELAEAQEELAGLRNAMKHFGLAGWKRHPEKEQVWHELSESEIPAERQKQIVAAADAAGTRRVSATGEPADTYQVAFLDRERTLIAARLVDDVVETESLMNRLVDTMSETFAHLSVGLMIFDDRNRLTLFNPAILEIFDEKADWLAMRPRFGELLDLWRRNGKLPDRLDYAEWKERFLKVGRKREAEPFEEKWHLPDGRSLRILCRQHPSGGLAIVVEDITEAVSLIRDTASERAVRSATTELLNQGLLVVGPDNRIRMMNAAFCRLWGIDGASASALHVSGLRSICRHRSSIPDFWDSLGATVTTGTSKWQPPQKLAMDNGRVITCQCSTMPDGSTLAVFSDITATETIALALKERNQALEQADEMRSALIDQTSHRMRTPLNSIYGYGQILAEQRFGALNEAQREYVGAIVASAGELVEVIDEMADLVSVGQEQAPKETVELEALLNEVADMATSRFPGRELALSCDGDGSSIAGDGVKLRQALYNLLIDALGRTAAGKSLTCALDLRNDRYRIQIQHPATAATSGGLALALARRAIAQSGGALDVFEEEEEPRMLEAVLPTQIYVQEPLSTIAAIAE